MRNLSHRQVALSASAARVGSPQPSNRIAYDDTTMNILHEFVHSTARDSHMRVRVCVCVCACTGVGQHNPAPINACTVCNTPSTPMY